MPRKKALIKPQRKPRRYRLSDRQRNLVDTYFAEAEFSKKRALEICGYKPTSFQYNEYFKHPAVHKEIERRHNIYREEHKLEEEAVLRRLLLKANANTGEILARLQENNYNLNALSEDEKYCISEYAEEVVIEGPPGMTTKVRKVKLKIESNLAAIDKVLRILGSYNDTITVNNEITMVEKLQAGRFRASDEVIIDVTPET